MYKVYDSMSVSVDRKKVLSRLGYRKAEEFTGAFERLFKESYRDALLKPETKALWRRMRIADHSADSLLLKAAPAAGCESDELLIKSERVAGWLAGCSEAYLMAVTIGEQIGSAVREALEKGDKARALIYDAVGSEVVEQAAYALTRHIKRDADYPLTNRYSPGFGDWGIENQREIDKVLNIGIIGIRLTESFMMIPEKSITALVGVKDMEGER